MTVVPGLMAPSLASSSHSPSSLVDSCAPTASSPPFCFFTPMLGGVSLPPGMAARDGHPLRPRLRSEMGPTGNGQRLRFGLTKWFTSHNEPV